ncbi:MAG: tetratricopeptide repeat protein [Planctomycetaceae bacterium]
MSGRRWIFTLLAAVPISATGCQVDGGATKMWNPFVRADKAEIMDDGQLPKFVRRATEDDDNKEKAKTAEEPMTESRVTTLLAEGQRALQENRITEAQKAYNEVMQMVPDEPTAHHGLAMAADLTEQWAEAEDHYRQALRSRPRDANLLCDIGYSYLLQNRYSEASSYLSQAIQINPNLDNAHTNLALLDIRQGNREAARQRLIQRYGNSEKVTQILAALESQTASKAATGLAATAPIIPENASFEEIREMANRERIAAEQRRAALIVPATHNASIHSASADRPANVPGQFKTAGLQGSGQQPNRFVEPNVDPVLAGTQAIGNYPSGIGAAENSAPNTAAPMTYHAPPQFGGTAGTATQASPFVGNPNVNPASAITGTMTGSWNPISMPPQNAVLSQYPNADRQYPANSGPADFNNQQPIAANNAALPTANTAPNSGGVIPVRPSGSFPPPVQGVSYGQPVGFGQAPSGSGPHENKGNPVTPAGTVSYGNAAYGNMGSPAANMSGQQYSQTGQNNVHVQLDGLNAGPGSLFPVGQGAGQQNGILRMENVSPPGSNAVINGAMYGQPVSTLPAQEWMMQQQQQIQQLNAQQQPPSQNSQGYTDPGGNTSQYSGNNPTGSQFGMPNGNTGTNGITIAPRPGIPAPPVNPLASHENQLRQLDNQYNNTLQQLDRNAPSAAPRAQY